MSPEAGAQINQRGEKGKSIVRGLGESVYSCVQRARNLCCVLATCESTYVSVCMCVCV